MKKSLILVVLSLVVMVGEGWGQSPADQKTPEPKPPQEQETLAAQDFGRDFAWYRYLGAGNIGAPLKASPVFGIQYYDRGFNKYKPQKTEVKTPRFLEKRGAGHLIPQFQAYEAELTATSDSIGVIIDNAYRNTKKRFRDCGGRWRQTADTFNPRFLTATVEEAPVWLEDGIDGFEGWVNGYTSEDGKRVYGIVVGGSGVYSTPKRASLVTFSALMEWELGNALGIIAGYHPRSIDKEVGSRPPCSVAP